MAAESCGCVSAGVGDAVIVSQGGSVERTAPDINGGSFALEDLGAHSLGGAAFLAQHVTEAARVPGPRLRTERLSRNRPWGLVSPRRQLPGDAVGSLRPGDH
jgi:hypothetical protein